MRTTVEDMERFPPEEAARQVLDAWADCDVCRFLMDTSCLFFPELYRLFDREFEGGEKATSHELRELVDLCNFCGQCPCPNIRSGIIEAKTRFIERDGLKFGVRTIEDVERIAALCGAFPRLTNALFQARPTGGILKAAMGIHESRKMPLFPKETFPDRAKKNNLAVKGRGNGTRKVAYFAGCTGKYLFPEVPGAVVEVFQQNGFEVYFPEQKCCGMPPFLEGDRQVTLDFARFNVERLADLVEEGYDVVCSCPTCGYMLRTVLGEGACFSDEYQDLVGGDEKNLLVPAKKALGDHGERKLEAFSKTIYKGILRDDGYFSSISPLKRIKLAENTYDLGQYLAHLYSKGELSPQLGPVSARMVYYPPCHLREQEIGRPYENLLKTVPGLDLEVLGDAFYCCGLAGVMGFKREFHDKSIHLGSPLMEKIREINPEKIVTDCLRRLAEINWTKLRSDLGHIWLRRLSKTAGVAGLRRGFCD
ncbi:MAG: heterodisulfide reductase-related iron-sulfur binding cluster [Thermodesulfobacteriota bacterium]